jgi:hypothetical protein
MFPYTLPLSGFPNGASSGLDMTADFAPLLIGMWVLLCLSVLGLAVATGIHDSWWVKRKAKKAATKPAPLPKAA